MMELFYFLFFLEVYLVEISNLYLPFLRFKHNIISHIPVCFSFCKENTYIYY